MYFFCLFVFRLAELFILYFQLNQAAGTTLLKLSVSDKDSPRNGPPFVFRIVSGNEGRFFSLDQTGTLKSNRVFGPEAPREFSVEIQVGYFFIINLYDKHPFVEFLLFFVDITSCVFMFSSFGVLG